MAAAIREAEKFGHRYPWATWLAADLPLTLTRGFDFPAEVQAQSLALMLRLRVARAGLARTIRVSGDVVTLDRKTDFRGRRRRAAP